MRKHPKQMTVLLHLLDADPVLSGIIDECRQLGWRLINLAYTSNYIPAGRTYAGAIISSIEPHNLEPLLDLHIPIVLTNDDDRNVLREAPRVLLDWPAVSRLAAAAFAERGFREIAYIDFITPFNDELFSMEELRDLVEGIHGGTLHNCSIPIDYDSKDPTKNYEQHVKIISNWVKELPLPLGVLAYNPRMGARIITACEMAGLSVPEEVAVMASGDDPALCETAPVPLSAIDLNETERGRELVRQLKRQVDGEPPPKAPIYVPPVGLIERRSTDILAVSDPMVASAIRFMWDHFDWPISVDDVAQEVGTSRSTIERAFRLCLGRGVIAELRRKRLERAKELLRGTTMTIAEITKAIGLTDKRYLQRAFKTTFGETLRHYRVRLKQNEKPTTDG